MSSEINAGRRDSDPTDIKFARLEQVVKDGFVNIGSKLQDIKDRNTLHDARDDERFAEVADSLKENQSDIQKLSTKIVYATGIVIGAGGLLKFLSN